MGLKEFVGIGKQFQKKTLQLRSIVRIACIQRFIDGGKHFVSLTGKIQSTVHNRVSLVQRIVGKIACD